VWVRGKNKRNKKDWPVREFDTLLYPFSQYHKVFQKCIGGLVRLDRDGEDVVADLFDIRRILGRGQAVSV
jgi:hypothetical protein